MAQFTDGNDFAVVETSICYGLKRYVGMGPLECGRTHTNTLITNQP